MFVKVAELASFTRAAEHLGLSKARVSTGVQELELTVGSRLLQRSTRVVRLTPDGEQFLGSRWCMRTHATSRGTCAR
jgi:DNA-binding transcriptional LysR family regulator